MAIEALTWTSGLILLALLGAGAAKPPAGDETGAETTKRSGLIELKDFRTPRTPAELSELRARAEIGEAQAQFLLGYCFGMGRCISLGLASNKEQALMWLERAGQQNYAPAIYWAGRLRAMPYNRKAMVEALGFFRRSADLGYVDAQLALAGHYRYGNLVEKDLPMAIRYCELGAQQEHPGAMVHLGELLLEEDWALKRTRSQRWRGLRWPSKRGSRAGRSSTTCKSSIWA